MIHQIEICDHFFGRLIKNLWCSSADLESHSHQANHDEVTALRQIAALKISAKENSQAPPITLFDDVENLPNNVIARMPN